MKNMTCRYGMNNQVERSLNMKLQKILLTFILAGMILPTMIGCITIPSAANTAQQPAVVQQQPANTTQQPVTTQQQPVNTQQQASYNQQQAANQQPANSQQQPANMQQQSTNTGQQPAANQQQPVPVQPPSNTSTQSTTANDLTKVTAAIKSSSDLDIAAGVSYFYGTIVIKISNDSTSDISDVELLLTVKGDEDIPDISSATLTGGGTTWTFDSKKNNTLKFSNSSGVDVDADSYEKITLTLQVYFDSAVTYDTEFTPSVSVTDYNK